MTDFTPFRLDHVRQVATISVDEYGSEAAAYTEVRASGAPRVTEKADFTLDRPFLLAIVDNRIDIPLFIGVVNDPTS